MKGLEQMIESRMLKTIFISALMIILSCSAANNTDTPKITREDVSFASTPVN